MPRAIDLAEKTRILRAFYARERRLPGYNEMLKLFGYRSKNAVFGLLRKLEEAGCLTKRGGKLAPTGRITGSIRMLGSVRAGFPAPADEQRSGTLSLDALLVERPDSTYMLKVSGDSMREAGILPDDLVLVEKGRAPNSGDIVVAHVDGEWTLKYFVRRGKDFVLEAANPAYAPIRPRQSLELGGIVRAVIRKFG